MLRILNFPDYGWNAGTLMPADCTNSDSNKVASASNRDRKIYYAHEVRTGSHMQQVFTEPTSSPDPSSEMGGVEAGDQRFVNSSAPGSFAGYH